MQVFSRNLAIKVYSGAAIFLTVSCAIYKTGSSPVIKECIVPADQTGTISGHWAVTPVPIAFYKNSFNASEITDITTAADIWNQFYTASMNITTIDYGGDSSNPKTSTNQDPTQGGVLCSKGLVSSGQFTDSVVIYKLGTWPSSYPASAIALTSFCPKSSSPYPVFNMAVIEINYQNFFVAGKKIPDLQSILLHELGHLMGLNHSCEGSTKAGTPNCSDPALNPDYVAASMYPVFNFDSNNMGQQKRTLGTNDQGRANCLYSGTSN